MVGMPVEGLAVYVAFQRMMSNLQQAGGKHDKQRTNKMCSYRSPIKSTAEAQNIPCLAALL